jgi:hypothetical protein
MRRFAALALALLLAGSVAACGDDDSDTSAPAGSPDAADAPAEPGDDPAPENGDSPSAPPAGDGAAGTAIVDGTQYAFDEALRCEDDDIGIDNMERSLEAQFLGRSDGGSIQLDLYISDFGGFEMHDVSWAGPEGIYSTSIMESGGTWVGEMDEIYQDAPISIDGNRATGSVVAYDAMTMEATIDIDFDVVIPSDTFACR